MTTLPKQIASQIKLREDSLARMADAGDIVEEYVLPALPASISRFEARVLSCSSHYDAPQDRATSISVQFHPGTLASQTDCAIAYGTIVKAAAGLAKLGWEVADRPEIEAPAYGGETLFVTVKADRKIPERKRWFRRHGLIPRQTVEPERSVTLCVIFDSMPETNVCRIEESVEHVPASTRTVRRVVCEEGGPAGLISSPALPS